MTEITLKTDPPHTPRYTRQLAQAVAETIRCLNHATFPGSGGLEQPADAESVLASLASAMSRMPQLFEQLAAWLADQAGREDLADSLGRSPADQADIAAVVLLTSRGRVKDLAEGIQHAQAAVTGLYLEGDEGD